MEVLVKKDNFHKMLPLLVCACFVIASGNVRNFPIDLHGPQCPLNIKFKQEVNCTIPENTVIPLNYKLELTPNFIESPYKKFTFNGNVKIKFRVTKNITSLTLHSKNLNFYDVILTTSDEHIIGFQYKYYLYECDLLHIEKTGYVFREGVHVLNIIYKGVIKDYSAQFDHGIFRGHYKNSKNKKRIYLSTFYPSLARSVFPCFDEPQYKANFELTVNHAKKYKVISNSPILKQSWSSTEFMKTPVMPPNLLSFIIGDFQKLSKNNNFAVYVRPDIVKFAKFGLDTGTLIFEAYEDYLNLQNKEIDDKFIRKLDLVGLPDFEGPVLSLGVISMNEKILIYNEQKPPSAAVFQAHVELIAEAIVQQWFGNFEKYQSSWINDGLKLFLAHQVVDKIERNLYSMNQFIVDGILNTAFEHDGQEEIHLENNFHQKGPAIIHMMQHFLTESVFRRGLQLYLRKKMPPDHVDLMFCRGLQNGSYNLWNKTFTLLLNTNNIPQKIKLIKNLGCSKNKTTLENYLNFAFQDNSPLLDYTETIIKSIYSQSDVAFNVVFEFILEKYNIFVKKIRRQDFVAEIIVSLAEKITTESNFKKLKEMKRHLPLKVISNAKRVARKNLRWIRRNKSNLQYYMNEEYNDQWWIWFNFFIVMVAIVMHGVKVVANLISENERTDPKKKIS